MKNLINDIYAGFISFVAVIATALTFLFTYGYFFSSYKVSVSPIAISALTAGVFAYLVSRNDRAKKWIFNWLVP